MVSLMSRISLLNDLYSNDEQSREFDVNLLIAPTINSLIPINDIDNLYYIAKSPRYSGNTDKKIKLLNDIMMKNGFKKIYKGTNRIVYKFLENQSFVAKVALDRAGLEDGPAEYKNQFLMLPFCTKIFEAHDSGAITFAERVNPIASAAEFISTQHDIFNLIVHLTSLGIVVDDAGLTKYMNYGIRYNNECRFGPVILDFPYVYRTSREKLICKNTITNPYGITEFCGGEIDWDFGIEHLYCSKCGRKYTGLDLKVEDEPMLMFTGEYRKDKAVRAMIVDKNGKIIKDSGKESYNYDLENKSMYDIQVLEGEKNTKNINCNERTVTKVYREKNKYYRMNKVERRNTIAEELKNEYLDYKVPVVAEENIIKVDSSEEDKKDNVITGVDFGGKTAVTVVNKVISDEFREEMIFGVEKIPDIEEAVTSEINNSIDISENINIQNEVELSEENNDKIEPVIEKKEYETPIIEEIVNEEDVIEINEVNDKITKEIEEIIMPDLVNNDIIEEDNEDDYAGEEESDLLLENYDNEYDDEDDYAGEEESDLLLENYDNEYDDEDDYARFTKNRKKSKKFKSAPSDDGWESY